MAYSEFKVCFSGSFVWVYFYASYFVRGSVYQAFEKLEYGKRPSMRVCACTAYMGVLELFSVSELA